MARFTMTGIEDNASDVLGYDVDALKQRFSCWRDFVQMNAKVIINARKKMADIIKDVQKQKKDAYMEVLNKIGVENFHSKPFCTRKSQKVKKPKCNANCVIKINDIVEVADLNAVRGNLRLERVMEVYSGVYERIR